MADLTVCAWRWGTKYGDDHVQRLAAGVARHLAQPHAFRIFTPPPEDAPLTNVRGCFARLRMWDPAWQEANGVRGRLLCLDLDLVVTGPLDPLVDVAGDFAILQGANAANPCPYNGSVMLLRTGTHPQVWTGFSLAAAAAAPFYEFPDDQAWLAAQLPGAVAWKVGPESGVYAFQKPGWPRGESLPRDARLVAFPGWRDPIGFQHLDWVKAHWRT